MSTTSSSESARDLLDAYNAAKMMKEEDGADMVADLLVRAGRSLIKAVKAGDIDECRELLAIEGVDIHIKDSGGYPNYSMTPVLWACESGHLNIAKYLVSKGADIHEKNNEGWSCLIIACNSGYFDIMKYLESKGADISEKINNGGSHLMGACYGGHLNIVEYLVSKGANIHDKDKYGCNCLMYACDMGNLNVAEYLVSEGANIHEMDNDGVTCFSDGLMDYIGVLYRLRKWPTTMAILVLQELALIYIIDSESLIDLHQYLGRPDDCSKSDNEEDYKKDDRGHVL